MRTKFGWILLSDLHLRAQGDTWAQGATLDDLVKEISDRREATFNHVEFLLVSGDLAFSGKEAEYEQVRRLLDDVRNALGLERSQIFMVAGNHDVDRDIASLAFLGARTRLTSAQEVEWLLGKDTERDALLARQSAFRQFHTEYCEDQQRQVTEDSLAFIAPYRFDSMPICIVGLNSSWICGDDEDDRKLLVGDRQIINAINLINNHEPRLVLCLVHHPCDWLHDFDRTAFEERFLPECDFLHRGHLHEPKLSFASGSLSRQCVEIAAGAGHAGRHFQNAYSYVEIDLLDSSTTVSTFTYTTSSGRFALHNTITIPLQLRGTLPVTTAELAACIDDAHPTARLFSHYLAALLLQHAGEVPMLASSSDVRFLNANHLDACCVDDTLIRTTKRFLGILNVLLAFPNDSPLDERLAVVHSQIADYLSLLKRLESYANNFHDRLLARDAEQRGGTGNGKDKDTSHTEQLLLSLENDGDWEALTEFSERHLSHPDRAIGRIARRYLALGLLNSDEGEKNARAVEVALPLMEGDSFSADDMLVVVAAYRALGDDVEAVRVFTVYLEGRTHVPSIVLHAGRELATTTGNGELRSAIDSLMPSEDE